VSRVPVVLNARKLERDPHRTPCMVRGGGREAAVDDLVVVVVFVDRRRCACARERYQFQRRERPYFSRGLTKKENPHRAATAFSRHTRSSRTPCPPCAFRDFRPRPTRRGVLANTHCSATALDDSKTTRFYKVRALQLQYYSTVNIDNDVVCKSLNHKAFRNGNF